MRIAFPPLVAVAMLLAGPALAQAPSHQHYAPDARASESITG